MNNKKIMAKINELDKQVLSTKEQGVKVMVQIALIRKAFGVKNDETNKPVRDYERNRVLANENIKEEFEKELEWLKISRERDDYHITEHEYRVKHFIEAVRFIEPYLADELEESLETSAA